MKYKQAVKFGFFELQSIKEDYLIAKGGKGNAFFFMRFLETQLVLMNPIMPHFAQYCWNKYVYPVFKASKNYDHAISENLCSQAWPTISAPYDKVAGERLSFLRKAKSTIREGLDKAKMGGKKKPKKGAEPEAPKVFEKCTVFVAKEYPEFKKQCLTILSGFEFDEDNKIVGKEYIAAISAAFDKKQAGIAMKFAAFQLGIAAIDGKEAGLRLESSFDEVDLLLKNKAFLFENMSTIKET